MIDLIIDSEFKELLPPLTEDQKEELEKDILKNGCLSPLVVWNKTLIDGHHRYDICIKHNIQFDLIQMEFKDKLEAMEWAWMHQKNRRNLTKYELAQIALKFKPVIEAKAKENQGKRNDLTSVRNLTKVNDENTREIAIIDTKKELAKIAGVSHDTIHKVEVIEERAPEEIKQQVKKGELTINSAYVLTKSAEKAAEENKRLEQECYKELEREKKEQKEQEEKKELEEIQKSLPENAVVLDKFRKEKETHIFGIEDFNNLTNEQFEKCVELSKKYQNAIYKINQLYVDEDSLKAWNCITDTKEMIDIELADINSAIQKLIKIQNYFKGVRPNE
jgi:ParB-like chromosome segregation protein Spo0J